MDIKYMIACIFMSMDPNIIIYLYKQEDLL